MKTIKNAAGFTEMLIYDVIGYDPFSDSGIMAKDIIDMLKGISGDIHLRINSPGGDLFEALAIYNLLANYDRGKVVVYIDGCAASAASVIAMAGSERLIPANAFIMIHNPMTYAYGDAHAMRETADMLDKGQASLIGIYKNRTGLDEKELAAMLDAETWMTGAEAVEKGFCTGALEEQKLAACADLSRMNFKNVPERLVNITNAARKRGLEDALREAGYPRAEAKKIVSALVGRRDADRAEAPISAEEVTEIIQTAMEAVTNEKEV